MTARHFFRLTCLTVVILGGLWPPGAIRAEDKAADADLDQKISQLISELGDSQFAVRQRAQRELTRLGHAAFDALTTAENSEDVEIATQARYLVRLIRIDWVQEGDSVQVRQILGNYETRNEQERLVQMKELAALPRDAGLAPLCRLARFEASPVLSKQAAAMILNQNAPESADWAVRGKTILQNMDRSQRPAAEWLRTYVQSHQDAAAALAAWKKLADTEQETLTEHPQLSQNALVQDLLRQQVVLLDGMQQPDEATAVIRKMIDLERGDPQTLKTMVAWLAKRNAWNLVDDVAARFSASFESDADLLYALAQARLEHQDPALAEETALEGAANQSRQAGRALSHGPAIAPARFDLLERSRISLRDWPGIDSGKRRSCDSGADRVCRSFARPPGG